MGKILVLFHSKDGATAQIAELVAEGAQSIQGMEVTCKNVADATRLDVIGCDGLALGSPTHMGGIAWEMKRFWDVEMAGDWGHIDGKIGCAFSSQGGWGGGAELTCQALLNLMMNYGMLTFGVTDYVAHQFTLHYGAVVAGQPRAEREQDSAKRLGQRLAEWVAVYVDGRREAHPLTSGRKRFPWSD